MPERKSIHIMILMLISLNCFGQAGNTDSVMNELSLVHDTVKLRILKDCAVDQQQRSLRTGLLYADKRMEIARRMNDAEKIAGTFHIYGNLYTTSGLLNDAEENYLKALEIFDSLKLDENRASILHNLGLVSFRKKDTLKSIHYYRKSIELRKSSLEDRRTGDELTTLGEVYLAYQDYDSSRQHLLEALEYYRGVDMHGRKIDAYAFLFDNYYAVGSPGMKQWIDSMIIENNEVESPSRSEMINLRLAKYHMKQGNIDLSAALIDSVNFNLLYEYEVIDPVNTIQMLSEEYRKRQLHRKAIYYSLQYRKQRNEHLKSEAQNLVSNYNIRLSIRASEENIEWARQQNALLVKRIRLERIISLTIYLALLIIVSLLAYLIYNLSSIRRTNIKLTERRAGLQEAYERSSRYKENILSVRENKSDFFSLISIKLSKPFHSLTDKLSEISEYLENHNKDLKLKTQMEKLFKNSSAIEKGLERILLWSKLQRNKYVVDKAVFNLNDFLHEVLPSLLGIALKKDIRIRFDVDNSINIQYDKFCLKTILTILTENSIEYSSPRSDIIVRAEKSEQGCILSVTDFGSGIPDGLKDKIFDISRVKNEINSEDNHKMGLGLLIVKLMTDKNDSSLGLESNKGSGTTIYLYINNTHD